MNVKRIVSTGFWDDTKVADVFSPEDKYFMLYLLTNPHTTQLGIYELSISKAACELGYSKDTVLCLLDRFENKYGIIKRSKTTGEIAIKNYLRHSIVKGGKPVLDCLLKDASEVADRQLLDFIADHISAHDDINMTVSEFLKTIKSRETEKEAKRQREQSNENDNDNDNERIASESYHESYNESSKKQNGKNIPPTLEEIEAYISEVGSQIDAELFFNHYESNGWFVGKTKMKNWHSAIATWERNKGLKRNKAKTKNNPAPEPEVPEMTDEEWDAMIEAK